MRVAIDARPAVSPGKTGVGHYTWNLIHHLPRVDPETTYLAWYLYFRRLTGRPLFFTDIRAPNFRERWTPFPARWFWRLTERYGLPRVEWFVGFDVFWATNFLPPPTNASRLVVTVHDLAYKLHPETAPHSTLRWLQGIDDALGRAAEVLVVSESTKRDLVELYPVPPERVTVTPLGVDTTVFRPPPEDRVAEARRRFGVQAPYLLYVGGIEPRKNLPNLVRAFAEVADVVPRLVIVGGSVHWNPEGWNLLRPALEALPSGIRGRVTITGYVSEQDKIGLLGGATALVFPSRYEGFGLPVLEALACGTPVVTSNLSSLPEVAGDEAVYVDPLDPASIAEGIRRVAEDEALRRRLREGGPRRAAGFTWERTARGTAEVLRRAGGR
ncbi:MAG TPA: glycosyltransferase family 1 protein [Actinomycetota bacterium]|nr:glycosyltransferase family 1 protein [Actinomycetota bacterium]